MGISFFKTDPLSGIQFEGFGNWRDMFQARVVRESPARHLVLHLCRGSGQCHRGPHHCRAHEPEGQGTGGLKYGVLPAFRGPGGRCRGPCGAMCSTRGSDCRTRHWNSSASTTRAGARHFGRLGGTRLHSHGPVEFLRRHAARTWPCLPGIPTHLSEAADLDGACSVRLVFAVSDSHADPDDLLHCPDQHHRFVPGLRQQALIVTAGGPNERQP